MAHVSASNQTSDSNSSRSAAGGQATTNTSAPGIHSQAEAHSPNAATIDINNNSISDSNCNNNSAPRSSSISGSNAINTCSTGNTNCNIDIKNRNSSSSNNTNTRSNKLNNYSILNKDETIIGTEKQLNITVTDNYLNEAHNSSDNTSSVNEISTTGNNLFNGITDTNKELSDVWKVQQSFQSNDKLLRRRFSDQPEQFQLNKFANTSNRRNISVSDACSDSNLNTNYLPESLAGTNFPCYNNGVINDSANISYNNSNSSKNNDNSHHIKSGTNGTVDDQHSYNVIASHVNNMTTTYNNNIELSHNNLASPHNSNTRGSHSNNFSTHNGVMKTPHNNNTAAPYYQGAKIDGPNETSSYSGSYYRVPPPPGMVVEGGRGAYTTMAGHHSMISPPMTSFTSLHDPAVYAAAAASSIDCGLVYETEASLMFHSYHRGYYQDDSASSYRGVRSNSCNRGGGRPPVLWPSLSSISAAAGGGAKYPASSPWSPNGPHSGPHNGTRLSFSDAIYTGGLNVGIGTAAATPLELQVTNLDQNIDAREMKKILLTFFREHVMVLHVSMLLQSDGNLAASLRVPSPQDAQYAISQLHRKKIGAKRIIISYVNHNQPSPHLKRSKVISLLQEVPGKKLPLFKFRELYERRFHETIAVSEMYNMRDIVTVSDNSTGRMVALHPEYRNLTAQQTASTTHLLPEPNGVTRFCPKHSIGPDASVGWAERDNTTCLPNIGLSIADLGDTIQRMLESHNGVLPLASLVDCYIAECGPVEEIVDGGVPFEHLVSCLPMVSIDTSAEGFKYIQWARNKPFQEEMEDLARFVSPPLIGQLALFSRELVDLLKTFTHTRLQFPRFIPAYHHHFGRQCRVADYGFTKLAELLDALPHVVQVLGEGSKRIITLAHKAQVKRFSSDLLRVLKGQPAKIIHLNQFSVAYEKTVGKSWDVTDYGVNNMDDLLAEVNESTVLVIRSDEDDDDVTISIPKREQTADEIERTRQFAAEVVELLRHSPQCRMNFNRFIPAYHHHFGRQCRVADYGFTKLIELFEAIPDLLEIFDDEEDGEKQLQLVERERMRVLGEQIILVVKGAPRQCLSVEALRQVFTHYYGYALKPQHYDKPTLISLLNMLSNYVQVTASPEGGVAAANDAIVTVVDRTLAHAELTRARVVLWQQPDCAMPLDTFVTQYQKRYGDPPRMDLLVNDVDHFVQVEFSDEQQRVQLSGVQVFARDLIKLLQEAGGRIMLANFDNAYLHTFGAPCRPARFGFASVVALVQALPDLVALKGRGAKKLLLLLHKQQDVVDAATTEYHCSDLHKQHDGSVAAALSDDNNNNIYSDSHDKGSNDDTPTLSASKSKPSSSDINSNKRTNHDNDAAIDGSSYNTTNDNNVETEINKLLNGSNNGIKRNNSNGSSNQVSHPNGVVINDMNKVKLSSYFENSFLNNLKESNDLPHKTISCSTRNWNTKDSSQDATSEINKHNDLDASMSNLHQKNQNIAVELKNKDVQCLTDTDTSKVGEPELFVIGSTSPQNKKSHLPMNKRIYDKIITTDETTSSSKINATCEVTNTSTALVAASSATSTSLTKNHSDNSSNRVSTGHNLASQNFSSVNGSSFNNINFVNNGSSSSFHNANSVNDSLLRNVDHKSSIKNASFSSTFLREPFTSLTSSSNKNNNIVANGSIETDRPSYTSTPQASANTSDDIMTEKQIQQDARTLQKDAAPQEQQGITTDLQQPVKETDQQKYTTKHEQHLQQASELQKPREYVKLQQQLGKSIPAQQPPSATNVPTSEKNIETICENETSMSPGPHVNSIIGKEQGNYYSPFNKYNYSSNINAVNSGDQFPQNGLRGFLQDSRYFRNRSNSYHNFDKTKGLSKGGNVYQNGDDHHQQKYQNGARESNANRSSYSTGGVKNVYQGSSTNNNGLYGNSLYNPRRSSFSRHLRPQPNYTNFQPAKHNSAYSDPAKTDHYRINSENLTAPPPGADHSPPFMLAHPEGIPIPNMEESAPSGAAALPTVPLSPPYDFQACLPDGSSVYMNVPPPPHHQPYQSSLVFGSPVAGGGASVVWGQMWSPGAQYPAVIASPMSPAHYIIPSGLSLSWSSIAASPPVISMQPPPPPPSVAATRPATISLRTLDEPTQCGYSLTQAPDVNIGVSYTSQPEVPDNQQINQQHPPLPTFAASSNQPFIVTAQPIAPSTQPYTSNSNHPPPPSLYDPVSYSTHQLPDGNGFLELNQRFYATPNTSVKLLPEGNSFCSRNGNVHLSSADLNSSISYSSHPAMIQQPQTIGSNIALNNSLVATDPLFMCSPDSNIFPSIIPCSSRFLPSDVCPTFLSPEVPSIPSPPMASTSHGLPPAGFQSSSTTDMISESPAPSLLIPPLVMPHPDFDVGISSVIPPIGGTSIAVSFAPTTSGSALYTTTQQNTNESSDALSPISVSVGSSTNTASTLGKIEADSIGTIQNPSGVLGAVALTSHTPTATIGSSLGPSQQSRRLAAQFTNKTVGSGPTVEIVPPTSVAPISNNLNAATTALL